MPSSLNFLCAQLDALDTLPRPARIAAALVATLMPETAARGARGGE